ncbi:MAG: sugar phosphate isomerase/epimerase [Chloroflexi bacterium]|nr:sugar phosphate isomerase/epimerase [Chloroflexota bacterium]
MQIDYAASTSIIQGNLDRLPDLLSHGFPNVEIGFVREENVPCVMDFVKAEGLAFGFHDPVPWNVDWKWPTLTDPDPANRQRYLRSVRRTFESAGRHGSRYVLVHFPSVHFHPVPGWDQLQAAAAAMESCQVISEWQQEFGIEVLLENVGPNPYVGLATYQRIFETFPNLAFCLDVGHLHLSHADVAWTTAEFAAALAPYTRQIHLYNTTEESYQAFHHVPAHPSQDPGEGWINLPELLGSALQGNTCCRIVFEYTPQYPASHAFLTEGIHWIQETITGLQNGSRIAE